MRPSHPELDVAARTTARALTTSSHRSSTLRISSRPVPLGRGRGVRVSVVAGSDCGVSIDKVLVLEQLLYQLVVDLIGFVRGLGRLCCVVDGAGVGPGAWLVNTTQVAPSKRSATAGIQCGWSSTSRRLANWSASNSNSWVFHVPRRAVGDEATEQVAGGAGRLSARRPRCRSPRAASRAPLALSGGLRAHRYVHR